MKIFTDKQNQPVYIPIIFKRLEVYVFFTAVFFTV